MPTVLITGANRGLGLEFVTQYAAESWDVVACCRAPDKADKLQALAKAHKNVTIHQLEVSESKSLSALAERLKTTALDLLINNAGIYSGGGGTLGNDKSQTFGNIDAIAWAKVLLVNTIAPIMTIQAFASRMKRGAGKKIINITSRMGSLMEMGAGSIAYRSSKAALNGAMRVVKHDLDADSIAIYNFHPGWVQTDMGGKSAHLTPHESVTAMRKTIAGLTHAQSGSYFNYDGQIIPW
jgi:NAD(P)-dependent dehydrogenase (short-subunit alcohol dehydrogenase family)